MLNAELGKGKGSLAPKVLWSVGSSYVTTNKKVTAQAKKR
jgi:hypothetical protein